MKSMSFCFVVVVFLALAEISRCELRLGFYADSCPEAESVVQFTVAQAVATNPGIAAGLLRLHFHDCFVRGCDGSVLVDSTGNNKAEKDAIPNFGLRGFEVIDNAKARLEDRCPGTVSCADILTYAARDAVSQVGGPRWDVLGGRRDGTVSRADQVGANLPSPLFNVDQLTKSFVRKGMTQEEMITLSGENFHHAHLSIAKKFVFYSIVGAHTIGIAHCLSFVNRLYNFSTTSVQDPDLDPNMAKLLKSLCPKGSDFLDPKSKSIALDPLSPNFFDNGYYTSLSLRRSILTSDQILFADLDTRDSVEDKQANEAVWRFKFVNAMVKMSTIGVLSGNQGRIRTNCRVVS
ncbi:peroxidase 5 [Selaginella moellendorffii]|uniref:peroxidase 5 n=1 Tax=Selaginella moellendorffii TaxID=88036 RepID=UPI000D1C3D46|nr:peroxidase 5 [Selaginella moellendorffii]|eukprot:XP_024545479.1 peroxidase 5 [Selaginella moellendorffii]